TIPNEGSYSINWGDGTTQDITSSNPTHTYTATGDYTVTAENTITRFFLNNDENNRGKLRDIQQWGTANWTNMRRAFWGASNMIMSASDSPNLAGVTNMSSMFSGASAFNQDISGWNVASVTDMSSMFSGASAFNQDIGGWNVASVTNMAQMFADTSAFNQDIGDWNVASVTTMNRMFIHGSAFTSVFNQDISGWNVAKVTDMFGMFFNNGVFNQDIGGWNVASVTSINNMFFGADAFNQNLGRWYVDETIDDLQTANPDYNGIDNLNVLSFNFVAQNARLREQTPSYTLATAAVAEGTDNARFTLTSNTLSFRSGEAANGTYTVRIAVSNAADFGSSNSIDLMIVVDGTTSTSPTVTSIVRTTPTDETTNADTLIWTLTFSEDVQNVDATDFTLSGTTA
ncbi:MAG: BspA family leucine-rich repeat surface protein, partial [Methylococcales symbiont of Iophon sp. n. MRB-2018]